MAEGLKGFSVRLLTYSSASLAEPKGSGEVGGITQHLEGFVMEVGYHKIWILLWKFVMDTQLCGMGNSLVGRVCYGFLEKVAKNMPILRGGIY